MSKRSYLFIVRGFNDVDHFTPILDAMCRSAKYQVHLYTSNMLLTSEDNENLTYLKKQHNLNLKFLLETVSLSVLTVLLKKILNKLYLKTLKLIFSEQLRWFVDRVIAVMQLHIVRQYQKAGHDWANDLITDLKPDVIVFDMTYPEIFRVYDD